MSRKLANMWTLIEIFRNNIPTLKNKKIIPFPGKNPEKEIPQLKADLIDVLIEQMLEIKEKYRSIGNENLKEIFKRQFAVLSNRVDNLIYERYGISKEELKEHLKLPQEFD